MKALDALLSRWVGEADESRADSAFRAYYSTAFPSLARFVQHRTGWDPASAEDIAQEALLRFFERTGRGRREAIALVGPAAMHLTASELGAPQSPQAVRWASDVSMLAGTVSGFRLPPDAQWRAAADDLWAQIVSLQSRGRRLIDEARRKIQWDLDGHEAREVDSTPAFSTHAGDADSADLNEDEIDGFARRLAHERSLNTSRAVAAEERYPGVGPFVEITLTVVATLPRLRLPTNGYLFDIATTLFLDEIKSRRRKKRGGAQEHTPVHEATQCSTRDMIAHPFEFVPDEPQADLEDRPWLDRHPTPEGQAHAATSMPSPAADPVVRYESEEFLRQFYEYLRSPVARAVRALEEARDRGRAIPEQSRLESVSRKFARMMTVLSMMGEGYTQEETARRAGLSRNQVKYIVESVKEAYARFTTDKSCGPPPRVNREGESHAP
jgi:DNA-directed RNA polymerase specialized sigma24 family protein